MVFDPEHLTNEEDEAIDGFCRASGESRETIVDMLAELARVGRAGSRARANLVKTLAALKAHRQLHGKRKRGFRDPYESKSW